MKSQFLSTVLAGLALGLTAFGADIVVRPEKLTFPALRFEPPNPAQFREPLKSGPLA